MNAEILAVGTELLLGNITNTNAAFISRKMSEIGVNIYYHTVAGDNPNRLRDTLKIALDRSETVIMTGGLGPTYDDLTKETVAGYFKLPLVFHQESFDNMNEFFIRAGRVMTRNNEKQALIIKDCKVFRNLWGTAPGIALEKDGKKVIMLPGPPREMEKMLEHYVLPYLKNITNEIIVSRTLKLFGIGESALEEKYRSYFESMTNPTVAPYAKFGEVELRITAKAESEREALDMIEPVKEKLVTELGILVYGVGVPSLEYVTVELLKKKSLTLSTAESCTGGLLSKRITDIEGSSIVFKCGFCVYSNEAKTKYLKVDPIIIKKYGAVSKETAMQMARNVKNITGTDIGISITGVAGPGGIGKNPVGLAYIAIAYKGMCMCKKVTTGREDRLYNRQIASSNALYRTILLAEKIPSLQ